MKRIIFIAAALLLSGALGLVFYIMSRPEQKDTPVLAEQAYITNLEDLAGVSVKNAAGSFTVNAGASEDEEPLIAGFEDIDMDTFYVRRLLEAAARLVSKELLEEPADLAPFGLAPPRAEIRLRTGAGETVLLAGSPAPDGSSVYLKKEGEAGIHLVNSYDMENYFKGALDFVNLELSPAGTDDGAGGFVFSSVDLGGRVRGGEDITIIKRPPEEKSGQAPQAGIFNSPYRITSPLDFGFSADRGLPLIQPLFGIRAARAAARIGGSEDLARYGLDRPYSTATVSGTLGNGLGGFSIRASEPDAEGKVYVQREGRDIVYEVLSSSLPWLASVWFDFAEKMIILPFIDSVASVEINTPEKKTVFSLSGEGDDLKVKSGTTDVDTGIFRTYYQTLLTASYEEYGDVSARSLQAPFLEIVYRYRDGKEPDTVSFHAAASRRVLVSLNGGRPFYTLTAYTDKVIADLDQILAGKKVRSYL